VRIKGQLLRHETDLDHGPHAVCEQPVVNLVDVGKVVNRIAVLVFVIYSDFILQDGVKTDVSEIGDCLYGAKVIAIALAQRKNCASRAEHLLPEMREWSSRCASADRDRLGRNCLAIPGEMCGKQYDSRKEQ